MPIARFPRLRNIGVFHDFTWPADLADFGRYNLIYGWNGSGKTTLSRVLRDMELRRPPRQGEATIHIDGADVRGEDFPQATLQVRVFNRDFVNESVFPAGGGDVPPIFVVGKESVEKQKEADRLKQERTAAEGRLDRSRRTKQQAERELDRFCQERGRGIKDALRSPGAAGANPYNNYDKSDFQGRAQKMAADGNADSHSLTHEQQDAFRGQIRASPKPKLPEISYRLPDLKKVAAEAAELLATTVVSATIQALKDDPARADWMRTGLGLHRDRQADACLFCEQPLPPERLATLEAHFSTEYERFLARLDQQVETLKDASTRGGEVGLPKQIELYDELAQEYIEGETAVRQAIDSARAFLGDLVRVLVDKRSRPFDRLTLGLAVPEVQIQTIAALNALLRKHNQICDDFDTRTASARDRLAFGMIADALEEFTRLRDAVQTAHATIAPASEEVQRLTRDIERLEREIVQHRQPAEELNDDLRKYLGHEELQLTIKETGYSITRNGVPADMLSEGETTAIALLYFLKSLEDRGFDKRSGVVVLDDPVSSLDANSLYLAFSLIRERTLEALQLFALTHNFGFFRQVRNWLRYVPGQRDRTPQQRPSQFYMLTCTPSDGRRAATLRQLDSLLLKYESEYHYLFACVYQAAKGEPAADLEGYYHLPNIARRLLESFLAFRHPEAFDNLWAALRGIATSDEATKGRILNFVQTHSHGPGVGQTEHDLSILGEGPAVLRDLLELIKAEDPAHYSAMEKLVAPGEAA